jgi:LacI family transcriptional regulator, repressor for deo operon, udp, cdd, tsx, nupC, and nupG
MNMNREKWINNLKITPGGNIPIATQLADQLHWMIASGVFEPEEKLFSVRKLADQLGINLHTVRAAYVKLETAGMIRTIQSRGSWVLPYNPLEHTENFSNITSNTIGVLLPDLQNPFYTEFLSGVDKVVRKERFIIIAFYSHGSYTSNNSEELNTISKNMLMAKGIAGLLVGPIEFPKNNSSSEKSESYFQQLPIPVVFVDRPEIDCEVVNLDAKNAGREATRHLAEHGHRRIALITGKTSVPTLNNCFNGYLQALEEHSLKMEKSIIEEVSEFSFRAGYESCMRLLSINEAGKNFTAVFIAGDILAVGALKAIREKGYSIPKDIAVIGYNNIALSEYTSPSLTTMSAPIEELGSQSAAMLFRKIHKDPPVGTNSIILPTELVIRKSCGCVA